MASGPGTRLEKMPYSNKSVSRVLVPKLGQKGVFRMIRLEEEKQKSLFSSPKQGGDLVRPYRVGVSDVNLLSEVLDTIDHGETSTQGSTSDAFNRWMISFQDQEHVFTSPILVCELKYNELIQVKVPCCIIKIIPFFGE